MNNNVKYYIITLKNIFLDDSETDIHFGVFENGKYYDLLTNKEIYMLDDNYITANDFLNSNCKLIGIKKEECSIDKVSLFLKFITKEAKDILIDEVNNMEKSIENSLNNNLLTENKIKKIKKEDFLINY